MAIGLADADANAILNAIVNGVSYAGHSTIYMQLHNGGTGPSGTNHVSGTTSRQLVSWGTPSAGQVANTNTITWSSAGATENITFVSFWTASTAGTFIGSGSIATPIAAVSGSPIVLNPGDVTLTISDAS